jgi:heat shock protein HslJ
MTQRDLTDLLERAADRTDVGPPPLDSMLRGVRRRRQRHAIIAGVGLTVAAVATAVVVPVLSNPPSDRTPAIPETSGPASRAVDLEGRWVVSALVRKNGRPAAATAHGVRLQLTFTDTRLEGYDGCNRFAGGYTLNAAGFRTHGLASNLIGCTPPPPPLQSRLLDVRAVARDQGGTYLEDAHGHVVIALVRR